MGDGYRFKQVAFLQSGITTYFLRITVNKSVLFELTNFSGKFKRIIALYLLPEKLKPDCLLENYNVYGLGLESIEDKGQKMTMYNLPIISMITGVHSRFTKVSTTLYRSN